MGDKPGAVSGSFTRLYATEELKAEQVKTLASRRRRYGLLAHVLFFSMDRFYGKARTLSKFKVLEIVARVPYQAWEHVAYIAMTHVSTEPHFARRVFDYVLESRQQQDNEQWHLFIIEEMIQKKMIREDLVKFFVIPQVLAFFYYQMSWLLYVANPKWSYGLNADFEDHAEHEYMQLVAENPQFEDERWESDFKSDYGEYNTVADVFRRIGLDERLHKEESLNRQRQPRFA
jgi:ubiquinol oxidase